jgi:hypothetical protein
MSTETPWWDRDYPGRSEPLEHDEALLYALWGVKERKAEPELFRNKWWDVRHLHPAQATRLFTQLYTLEIRRIIRAHIDPTPPRVTAAGRVIDWHPIKEGDALEPPSSAQRVAYWKRKVGGIIRARQRADQDGIPYDLFVAEGLRHYYFGAGTYMLERAKMPEPNLLTNEDCLYQIRVAWLDRIEQRVQLATHPRFTVKGAGHTPDRGEHLAWIRQQIVCRPAPERSIARVVGEGMATLSELEDLARNKPLLSKLLTA